MNDPERNGAITPMSRKHTASCEEEKTRIKEAGGFVIHFNGCERVCGEIAVSRSIGELNPSMLLVLTRCTR